MLFIALHFLWMACMWYLAQMIVLLDYGTFPQKKKSSRLKSMRYGQNWKNLHKGKLFVCIMLWLPGQLILQCNNCSSTFFYKSYAFQSVASTDQFLCLKNKYIKPSKCDALGIRPVLALKLLVDFSLFLFVTVELCLMKVMVFLIKVCLCKAILGDKSLSVSRMFCALNL